MLEIDNRPLQIAQAIAYRENDLRLIVNVDPEINLNEVEISVELQNSSGKKLYDVNSAYVSEGNILIDFTKTQVKSMPNIANCVIKIDGISQFGYKIQPRYGFGIPQSTDASVSLNLRGPTGDITPEAAALALQINNQALQVEADTEAVGLSAQQVEAARQQVAADKVVVQQESGVASDMADSAIAAKNTAVAAKDTILQSTQNIMVLGEVTSISATFSLGGAISLEINEDPEYPSATITFLQ